MAEQDFRDDKELTGFDAFGEEELDDDEPQSEIRQIIAKNRLGR
jgi:hypothetical protein